MVDRYSHLTPILCPSTHPHLTLRSNLGNSGPALPGCRTRTQCPWVSFVFPTLVWERTG